MQALTERELFIYQLVTKKKWSFREIAELLDICHTGAMKAYQRAKSKVDETTTLKH